MVVWLLESVYELVILRSPPMQKQIEPATITVIAVWTLVCIHPQTRSHNTESTARAAAML